MDKNDEALMMEYMTGDPNALTQIFARYKIRLLNFALRMTQNLADAEDVVGDAFYRVSSKRYQPDPSAKFSTWLYTVAHNLCIEKIRKGKKNFFESLFRQEGEEREKEFTDTRPGPAEIVADRDMAVRVREAIRQLPTQYREAIILREYENMDYTQIALVMGCTLSSVKTLIFRAREKLRDELLLLWKEGSDV